jgi:hypothetical protein
MDFTIRSMSLIPNEPPSDYIVMSGEIKRGDVERFRNFAEAHSSDVVVGTTILDSPGGDVDEAMRLAQVARDLILRITVPAGFHCVSACFFIYVASAYRVAWSQTLGVHRPRFDAAVIRGMSLAEAQKAHDEGFARAKAWLQAQFVPQALIDKLLSLPSSQVYWLTDEDIYAIGERAPWYEEWLLARCPGYIEAQQRFYQAPADSPSQQAALEAARIQVRCEFLATLDERRAAVARFTGRSPKRSK